MGKWTKRQAIDFCLVYPDAYEDYPFDGDDWAVIRHTGNKRSFALIFEREGNIWMNCKAEPMTGEFFRNVFPAVLPAYHMNKTHWNSVILDGSMTADEVRAIVDGSYEITLKKSGKRPEISKKSGASPNFQ